MTAYADSTATLPPGFEDLQPLAFRWALATEQERYAYRLSTDMDTLRHFYDAIHPRMDDVMRYLCGFPADDLPALDSRTRTLFRLALSYFEASHPIELKWKNVDLDEAFPADRILYQAPSCSHD